MPKKRPGDRIELGDTLGHPMEPYRRWARLVAYRKHARPIEQFVIRLYRDGDGRWPTGEYRTTSTIGVQAWEGDDDD